MRRRSLRKQTISLVAALTLVVAVVVITGLCGGGSPATAVASAAALDAVVSDTKDAYAEGIVEIDLSDPASVDDANVSVENGVVKISAAGVYSLSGALDGGQIQIDAKGKVYLELNGIDVTSASGPALWIENAKKVTLVLATGTTNSLVDTATGDADAAALLSNDSLVVTGSGALNVVGNNSEGISGDDDMVINSGTITVTARGDGLAANDDITINGGEVSVIAGGDGLDSNGTVHVNGGRLLAFGGLAQGEGGIDARGGLIITGGTVVAGGNAMATLGTSSRQTSVYVTSGAVQTGGTTVSLRRDGEDVFTYTPTVAYQNVLISSGELAGGVTYQAYLGEEPGNLVLAVR